MEKFFRLNKDCRLSFDYLVYKENLNKLNDITTAFMKKHEITASGFYRDNEQFYIVPTENDILKFSSQLGKVLNNGLRPFKLNSKINKDWVNTLKELNIKVIGRPMCSFYYKDFSGGKFSERIFDIEGVVYTSFECGYEIETPEGFEEIKASEFYKIIEDNFPNR